MKTNTKMKAKRFSKSEFIKHWHAIEPQMPLAMKPISYRHTGSTFDEDGIRILGSKEFIDSVLSRLKDLLDAEAVETRLQVNYCQAVDKDNNSLESYSCYIQIRQRSIRGSAAAELEGKKHSPFLKGKF